jgi:hypothetical protein
VVLEKPLGDQAEGSVIQCDEEVAAALVQAGVAREATEEDVAGADDDEADGAEMQEGEDGDEVMQDSVRRLATTAEQTVTKAVEQVAEKLARSVVKRPAGIPGNRHVAGSDLLRTGGFKNLGDAQGSRTMNS